MIQGFVYVAFLIVTIYVGKAEFAQKPVFLQIIDEDDLLNLNQPKKRLDAQTLLELLKSDKKILPKVINLNQPLQANLYNRTPTKYEDVDRKTEDLTIAAPPKRDINNKIQSILNNLLIRIENDSENRISTKSRNKRGRSRDNRNTPPAPPSLRANKTRILKFLNGLVHEVNENKKKKRLSLKRNRTSEMLRVPQNNINVIYFNDDDNDNDDDYSDTYKLLRDENRVKYLLTNAVPIMQKYFFNEINFRYPVNGQSNPQQIINNKKQRWQNNQKQYKDETDTEYRPQDPTDYTSRSDLYENTGEYYDDIFYREEKNKYKSNQDNNDLNKQTANTLAAWENNFQNKDGKTDRSQRYNNYKNMSRSESGGLLKPVAVHNDTKEKYYNRDESQSNEIMLALEHFLDSSEKMTDPLKDEIRAKLEKDKGFESKFNEWKEDLKHKLKSTLQGQISQLKRKPWSNERNVYMIPVDKCPPPLTLFEGRCLQLPPHK